MSFYEKSSKKEGVSPQKYRLRENKQTYDGYTIK